MTRWYKRPGVQIISDSVSLTLEEKGAFGLVLDLIGVHGGPIADNGRWLAGLCNVSLRKWTALRDSLLAKGLLVDLGGQLGSPPAYGDFWASAAETPKPPRNRDETRAKSQDNSEIIPAKSRDNSAENRPPSNENNGLEHPARKSKNKIEKIPPHSPPPGGVAGGGVDPRQVDLEEAISDTIPPFLRRDQGFEAFWRAFDPPPDASRLKAQEAWRAISDLPPLPELLACVAAYRKFIADESATRRAEKRAAKPMLHPARWLEERRWEGFAAHAQAAAATAASDAQRKDDVRRMWNGKGEHLASLIGEAQFAAWFGDAELDGATIRVAKSFSRDHITQKFWKPLVAVFGSEVSVELKEALQ